MLQLLAIGAGIPGVVQHCRIARRACQQLRVIAKGILIRSIGPKCFDFLLRDATGILRGQDVDRRAMPAGAGFDAEKVVAGSAVRRADLGFAPPGFQRGMAEKKARRSMNDCAPDF